MHSPGYRLPKMNLMFNKYTPTIFSPKVRYPNRKFHAKNWTSQRGARGPVHSKSIYH